MAAVGLLVLGGGCAGYRLGTTLPPGIRTVHVAPFVNRTGEPELEVETTRATIQEFQSDGTLRLAGPDRADAVVEVTLRGFQLEPLRYDRDESRTVSEYRVIIDADLVFRRSGSSTRPAPIWVRGDATFEAVGDLALGKLDALPEASRDLARKIVKQVVEFW